MRSSRLSLSQTQRWARPNARLSAHMGRFGPRGPLLQGLGQSSGASTSQYNAVAQMLVAANAGIKSLEASVAASPDVARAIGAQVIEAQQRYTELLQAYIYAYSAVFGTGPDVTGMELGQWQVYVVVGVGIAVIAAALVELEQFIQSLQTQANAALAQAQADQAQQSNVAYAQNQLSAAQAAGDAAGVAQWTSVLQANASYQGPTAGSGSFRSWISGNWGWVALAAAGIVVLPKTLVEF